jgi:acyl carrier protein
METMDVQSMVFSKLAKYSPPSLVSDRLANEQKLSELDLDSLALLEVLYDLEEHYSITVDTGELHHLHTISDLVEVVDRSVTRAA